jgi:23S rRNA (uracil1939-C5)-methyltransferase
VSIDLSDLNAPDTSAAAEPRVGRPERGQELELEIQSLAFGGEGVARWGDQGYVVFVAGAVPGDRVRAVVHKRKRSYAHARTVEVLQPSPERIPATADHPGVPWQVLPYERQLEIKHSQVAEALRRIGHLDDFVLEDIVPALEPWRYRNKLEYSFGQAHTSTESDDSLSDDDSAAANNSQTGEDSPSGELVCGFHAPAGWNRVLPMEDCLLASELGNQVRRVVLAWARQQGLKAWSRGGEEGARRRDPAERVGPDTDGRVLLRNLVVREGRRTGQIQVRLVSTDGELDIAGLSAVLNQELGERLSGFLWTRSRQVAETTTGGETELVSGVPELNERLGELDLRISSEAFFQTNTEMAEVLYGIAAEYAALEGWERVYDLYSGIGTIALTLAPRAGEVWGVELIEAAVANAIETARRNEVTNVRFFAGDTRLALPELVQRAGRPDLVVVDPPRAGLSQKVVRRIIEASPKRIVYVSCNPTTLAPNAAQLEEAGWKLRKVRPVDMFPQTHHVECVALLERVQGARAPAQPDTAATTGPRAADPRVADVIDPRQVASSDPE